MILLGLLLASLANAGCVHNFAASEIPGAIAGLGWKDKPCGVSDPCVCVDGFTFDTAQWDGQTLSIDPVKAKAKADKEVATLAERAARAATSARIIELKNKDTLTALELAEAVKLILREIK